ncbi:MAG: yttP 3 [Firmicutes bacterium]|nr:yttP 3 [Bacillota bacterium]
MRKKTADEILDAASTLFAKRGFEYVTIKQLAKEANVNCAAVSYYFGGKDKLYQEVLSRQFLPALQALRKVRISYRSTATERLGEYAKMIAAVKSSQPYLTTLWHYEINRRNAVCSNLVKEYTVQFYQSILFALSHGISQNEFLSDLEPYSATSVLMEIMHAPYASTSVLTEQGRLAEDDYKDYTIQAIYHYLQGIRNVSV